VSTQQDQSITAAVQRALSAREPLRISIPQVEVQSAEGVVTLSGFEPSYTLRRLAEEVAASVPGVREVRNELSSDPEVEQSVALTLTQAPRTREVSPWIQVKAIMGVVLLSGDVPSKEVAAAAEEAAHSVRGVREVRNLLQVAITPH
jgi:hyperosmotically inducible protein